MRRAGRTGQILTAVTEHAGTITIDNTARRNAMTLAMWRALADAVRDLDRRDGVVAIVIRGAGHEAFCAGADISEFERVRHDRAAIDAYDAAIAAAEAAIGTARHPTIAMIHGVCAGGGAAIALACDLRFASDALRFSIPAAKIGAVYPPATIARLVRIVGPGAALDAVISGRGLGTQDALALRLIERAAPSARLEALVREYVAAVHGSAQLSIRAALLAVRAATDPDDEGLRRELLRAQEEAAASADYREGVRAFLEKRTARFGRSDPRRPDRAPSPHTQPSAKRLPPR